MIQEKEFLIRFEHLLKDTKGVLVCLTGGVDSSLVLTATARILKENIVAITFISPLQSKMSIKRAHDIARMLKIPHITYNYYPLSCKEIRFNKSQRCYVCKDRMFSRARRIAQEKGLTDIFDGTHSEDREVNRPGMRALREHTIRSPLKELGLTKADIRTLAQRMGVANWDLPSESCLATKFPEGSKLSAQELRKKDRT
ncbi:MAG: asparagine synthase-related protein [bacterium]